MCFLQLHGVYLAVHRLVLSRCAPWGEFASPPSFERPGSGAAAVDRMERNIKYFGINYICVCSALGMVCALLNPGALLIGAICGVLCAAAKAKGELQVIGKKNLYIIRREAIIVKILTSLYDDSN